MEGGSWLTKWWTKFCSCGYRSSAWDEMLIIVIWSLVIYLWFFFFLRCVSCDFPRILQRNTLHCGVDRSIHLYPSKWIDLQANVIVTEVSSRTDGQTDSWPSGSGGSEFGLGFTFFWQPWLIFIKFNWFLKNICFFLWNLWCHFYWL